MVACLHAFDSHAAGMRDRRGGRGVGGGGGGGEGHGKVASARDAVKPQPTDSARLAHLAQDDGDVGALDLADQDGDDQVKVLVQGRAEPLEGRQDLERRLARGVVVHIKQLQHVGQQHRQVDLELAIQRHRCVNRVMGTSKCRWSEK